MGTKMSPIDALFLQRMIAHHQAALDMSKLYLSAPGNHRQARVSDLARNIIDAQTAQISQMKSWLVRDGYPLAPFKNGGGGMSM